jgi:hypothetical protein
MIFRLGGAVHRNLTQGTSGNFLLRPGLFLEVDRQDPDKWGAIAKKPKTD